MKSQSISVIVPIYNEEQSLPYLFEALLKVLDGIDFEIIAVNDGSRDNSFQVLKEWSKKRPEIKVINFKKNFGQTAAINAGIQHASKEIFVFIDSDLENDPNDIPKLLNRLSEGYDVVSGWRKQRWKGEFITRKLPSKLANGLISYVSGVKLHDYGCTLKAYKKEVIEEVILYGEMHRFIPIYCKWQGGEVAELEVNYQPRKFGKSNYGISRTFRVLLDLVLIRFFDKYINKPMHFFGGVGLFSILISFFCFILAVYFKITGQKDFVESPLILATAMFFILGVVIVLIGVVAEMVMRTYYESQNKKYYLIKQKINFS